jgi:hypothetical protein
MAAMEKGNMENLEKTMEIKVETKTAKKTRNRIKDG